MIRVIDLDHIAGILMTFYILYQLVLAILTELFCKSDCEVTSWHLWHAKMWTRAHKTRVLLCELVKDIAIYLLFNPHNAQKLSLEKKCVINSFTIPVLICS